MKKSYKLIFIILFLFFTFQTVFSEEEDYCRIEGPDEVVGGETVNFKIDVKLGQEIKKDRERSRSPGLGMGNIVLGTVLFSYSLAIIISSIITGGLSLFALLPLVGGMVLGGGSIWVGAQLYTGAHTYDGEIEVCIPSIYYVDTGGIFRSKCEKYSIDSSYLSENELINGVQREITVTIPKISSDNVGKITVIMNVKGLGFFGSYDKCFKYFLIYKDGKYRMNIKMEKGNIKEDISGKEIQFDPPTCIIESPENLKGVKGEKVEDFCEFPI
ncbi:MAG: hypothetical protein QXI09_02825, partial [Candidatus Aenigmatarchaeota archaeon]